MIQSTTLWIIAFVLLWNSGFIGAEYGVPYTGVFTFLFWRYWALTLILLVYLAGRGRLEWPGFIPAALASVVGILAHGVWLACVFLALERDVPAGIVALVIALQPMSTGALSGIAVGESTSARQWLGLLIGFSGVAIAVGARIDLSSTDSILGYLLPFGSVAAFTVASLIQRRLELYGQSYRLPVDLGLFYQSLATGLAVMVPAIALEHLATRWEPVFLGTLLWVVVMVSLGAYALMWLLLSRLDATRVASLFYLGPPVTMLMAWVVFGDTLQTMDLVGLLVISVGVLMVQWRRDGVKG